MSRLSIAGCSDREHIPEGIGGISAQGVRKCLLQDSGLSSVASEERPIKCVFVLNWVLLETIL